MTVESKIEIIIGKNGNKIMFDENGMIINSLVKKQDEKINPNLKMLKEEVFNSKDKLKYDSLNDIYYFEDYFSKNRNNENFSEDIIKAKNDYVFFKEKYFNKYIENINLNNPIMICLIPSSKKGFSLNPIRLLAKDLIQLNSKIEDGTTILERIETVKSNHISSLYLEPRRTYSEEINSIKVNNESFIKDKVIILLDDITTTGNSFKASRNLLKKFGAKKIYCLALAKTSWKNG